MSGKRALVSLDTSVAASPSTVKFLQERVAAHPVGTDLCRTEPRDETLRLLGRVDHLA